jgi:hypothetical protein
LFVFFLGSTVDTNSDACILSGNTGTTPLIPLPEGTTVLHNDAGKKKGGNCFWKNYFISLLLS